MICNTTQQTYSVQTANKNTGRASLLILTYKFDCKSKVAKKVAYELLHPDVHDVDVVVVVYA